MFTVSFGGGLGISDIIQIISIGISTILSIALFVVSSKTHKMNKRLIKRDEEEKESIAALYFDKVKNDARYLYDTVAGQASKFDTLTIKQARNIPKPSHIELGKYVLDKSKHRIINKIWDLYTEYYSKTWMDIETSRVDENHKGIKKEEVEKLSEEYAKLIMNEIIELEK